jgi:hypothetical protein
MPTSTASKQIPDLSGSFDAAADRARALNEKLIVTAKKSGTASLDAYEKGLTTFVDIQQKVAGASQLDWVSAVVQAQTDFLTEVSAAYTSAAREVLK